MTRAAYKQAVQGSDGELRCFFPCELDLIVEHFRFRLDAKYRDFDQSPLKGRSPKQICACTVGGYSRETPPCAPGLDPYSIDPGATPVNSPRFD
jgi:hypothetical protein